MTKIGIIGAGGMGGHHARTLDALENVEIVGVADVVEEKARTLADRHGAKWVTDFRDLLPEVEAVFICTPPFARTDVVIGCAEAGKAIFAEKPIALDLDEADRMIEATERAGVPFMIGYVLRFTQPFQILHDTFVSGALGRLVSCWTRRYMPWNPAGRWYGDQEKSGGVTVDFFSHDLDWLRWIGGDVQTVYGKTERINPEITADDNVWTFLTFEEGAGVAGASWAATLSDSSIGIVGTKGSMIVDRSGTIRRKLVGGEETEVTAEPGESIQAHFVRCVEEGLQPQVTGHDARAVLEIALAIMASSRTGEIVKLGTMS